MSITSDKIRILVIEDDELDRMIIKKALKGTNINTEIVFAEDIDSGVNAAKGQHFDCIFLDYNLPGGNGLEAMKEIRDVGNNSPIIIITSQGDERIAVDLMKNGAADYVPKSLLTTEGTTQILRYIFRLRDSQQEKGRFEKAFLNTQKTLSTVAANAPIILFSVDTNGILTMLEGKEITGFNLDKKNYLLKESTAIGTENTLPISEKSLRESLGGKEVKEELERNNKCYEVFYSPHRNEFDAIIGVIGVATDITGHKQTEELLTTKKIIAEETARIKQEFLANMSHEIRTPMNGIIGLADILSATKINSEQRKYIQSIISCSENLLLIINDILDISKIEAGRMSFEKMPFNLNEVIDNSLSIFARNAAEKNIKLTSLTGKKVPNVVVGDSVRLSQVLNNLIGNAIKFTPTGEVTLTVSCIEETKENATLVFKVRDTGIGIPAEKQQVIFESFTQAGSDTTRRFGGTGLGLAIVKKILELQGGSIALESVEGEGSLFSVTLSVCKATEEEIRNLKQTSSQILSAELSNLNILAVEDNDISQLVLKKYLTDWKANFMFAENGKEAVELVKKNKFDLVIMDIQMPVMDGYEATRIIRNQLASEKGAIPIIALTANATDAERIKCMECGMNDYLSKPFRAAELMYKITENCSNKNISLTVHSKKEKKIELSVEESNEIIDLQYLKRVAENEAEFIRDMIAIFMKRTPEAIKAIRNGLAESNFDLVWQTAHRIKPTFSYMGMAATSALSAQLEKLYKTTPDRKRAEELLTDIENNFLFAQSLIEKEFLVTK